MMIETEETTSTYSTTKLASNYMSTSLTKPVELRIGKQGLAATEPKSVPQFFHDCCKRYANKTALVYADDPKEPKYTERSITYKELESNVEQTALMLIHVGLKPRTSIGVLASNCPEWFYAEYGALRANAAVAGIYPSSSPEAVRHVLATSQATVCVVDDAAQMAKVREVKERLPLLSAVIQIHGPFDDFVGTEDGYYRWEDLFATEFVADELREELTRREDAVRANDCALLIFTSGTTGLPKAAMLSHDSLIINSKSMEKLIVSKHVANESIVSFLPLNHIVAQLFDVVLGLSIGATIYYADRDALRGTITKTFVKARPTILFGVPRVFEKIQESLRNFDVNSFAFSRCTSSWARQVTLEHHLNKSFKMSSTQSFKLWLASKITHQIKYTLGLDQCKSLLVGGAPISTELKKLFVSLDMPLCEVYGLSEAGGALAVNTNSAKLNGAGNPLDGVEIKINNPNEEGQGEICVCCRSLMMGYLNDPEKTKETFTEDGWLLSGDLGSFDAEGYLAITGRVKELVITAGGENIPPVYVEDLVKAELPCVSNAILVGDHRKYLTILLTLKTALDPQTGRPLDTLHPDTIAWLQSLDLHYTRLSEVLQIPTDISGYNDAEVVVKPDPKIVQAIDEALKRANKHSLSSAQKVQKFALLPHDFSVSTGELGETLKARRPIILKKYAAVIDRLYS